MINTKKFKAKMAEKGHTYKSLALKMRITGYTLGQKVSNKKKMTLEEANICAEELNISDLEFKDIFLQNKLRNATK